MIKLLHIIKSLGRGGAEMLLPETLRLHDQSSFEFHYLYFLPWKDQLADSLLQYGGRVQCLSASNNIEILLKVRSVVKYIRENNIDLVHAHLPWAGVVARMAGKWAKVPVIYTEHNKQERYHFGTRFINLNTMNWLTEVIAVSDDVEESIKTNKHNLRIPVRTIVNGVDIVKFAKMGSGQAVRKLFNIPDAAPVVGTIAVFRFQKRLEEWIEVAATILQKQPDTHFIIVGDGPMKEQLHHKRAVLGLEKNLHFAGLQRDVIPFLLSFDIYMMSSVFEGLPIALLEAMSMEIPVVTTNAGGIKQVIRHGVDGFMVDVDHWRSIESHLLLLITNNDQRRKMGKAARERVVQSFSLQRMVTELEQMYRDMVTKAARTYTVNR